MIWFISDAHISEQMYVHRPLIKGDSYRALDSIVEKIISKNKSGSVIFCGDNFNSNRPSAKDVHVMSEAIYRLQQKGIAVYAIQGNHDLSKTSWMDLCDVISLNRQVLEIEGKKVYGIDYTPGTRIFDELEYVDQEVECDILVLHQPFTHNSPFDSYAIEVDDIPGSVREAVVSGHIHIPDKRLNSLGISVVSPGATHPRNISEPAGTYVEYNGTDFLHISTPCSRPIHRFQVTDKDSFDSTVKELEKLAYMEDMGVDDWPLVEVKYLVDQSRHLEKLDGYSARCHLFTKPETTASLEREDIEVDIHTSKEDILEQCAPKDSPEYDTTLELLTGNPDAVIEKMEFEFRQRLEAVKNEDHEVETT
jgi:DNA repair exonuclease SbcCD nuclease subunit